MVKVKIREVIKNFPHSLDLLLFNSFLIKSEFYECIAVWLLDIYQSQFPTVLINSLPTSVVC